MATLGGGHLVGKALKVIRHAVEKTGRVLHDKLPQVARAAEVEAQPVYARNTVQHHPISRIAAIRQSQSRSRWYSTQQAVKSSFRPFSSSTRSTPRYDRTALPTSQTSQAVSRVTSRAPFASSLRPNLTGGTLCRSAGGYSTGAGRIGGARYFSHTPAAPAQVVNNVSQAVRAFWLSGQKAQFDGMSPRNEKRFKTISPLQEKAARKMRCLPAAAPGSYVDFKVTPTITAIGPLSKNPAAGSAQDQVSLNNSYVMDMLSIDFGRALKDLAIVMNDLQKLSNLGDLPIYLPNSSTLRVRFPGCDAETVDRLCEELSIRRGLVYQDENFDASNGTEMALLFPFAPSHTPSDNTFSPKVEVRQRWTQDSVDWQDMQSPRQQLSPKHSILSATSHDFEEVQTGEENPWLMSPSGYSSLNGSGEVDATIYSGHAAQDYTPRPSRYEGLEGIYRFLEECDRARR
ncbi:hypothetical protein GJ744_007366 [Endocarpon pusillum]|uniref:Casein kinase II beta 2 subunit n=1 Tax=Endocarpon pusillum TaxID=364733 RepID=A0A8H7ARK2_9EURO|nr:hypothetical protein GJ744_007366 [Endocarpon pusillum]